MGNSTKRVAVIGGGLAGLTGALYLARAGMDVHIFEKSTSPGGRARTIEKHGLLFNFGAHALYADGAARQIFDELRIPYSGGFPDLSANDFIADGRRLTMPTNAQALLLHADFSVREKWELIRVMLAIQKAQKKNPNADLASMSTRDWLHSICQSPRMQNFFEGMFRLVTYSADLDRLSADAGIIQFQLGAGGVLYLNDGWQSLVDGLLEANRAAGTEFHPGSGIESLERDAAGRMVLRSANDESTASAVQKEDFENFDFVLLACDPKIAARIAGSQNITIDADRLVPVSAACLDVGLSSLPVASGLVLDFDRRLYFSIHSDTARLTANKAPPAPGAALIHTAKYLRHGESTEGARAELESFLDRLQPGWRDRVIHSQYLPRITVTKDLPDSQRGGLAGRTKTDSGAAADIYLAGDWVGEHGLLSDAALASARTAAGQIIARANLAGKLEGAAGVVAAAAQTGNQRTIAS